MHMGIGSENRPYGGRLAFVSMSYVTYVAGSIYKRSWNLQLFGMTRNQSSLVFESEFMKT